MDEPPGPLTLRDWRTLARALTAAEPAARRALVRLMRHHGVDARAIWGPADDPPTAPAPRAAPPAPRQGGRDRLLGPAPDVAPAETAPPALVATDPAEDAAGLDFSAVAAAYPGPRWELVGPISDLTRAAVQIGLDTNAIRMATDGPDPDATVAHPSPFCEDPAQFLALLAVLARTAPHVRLYRVARQSDGPASVLVKVFPDPGPETLAFLEQFHPEAAAQVRDAARGVAAALAHLHAQVDDLPAADGPADPDAAVRP